ncbi:hypothetical protein JCM5353_007218 [Sporobolomyces roseus]
MPPDRQASERTGFLRRIWSQWWLRLATGITIAIVPVFGAPLAFFMAQWIVGIVPITQCVEFIFVGLMIVGHFIIGLQTSPRLHFKPNVHMTWADDSAQRIFWSYYIATAVIAVVYYLCAFGFLWRKHRSERRRTNDQELDDLGGRPRGRTPRRRGGGRVRLGSHNSSARPPLLPEGDQLDHTSEDDNEDQIRRVSAGPSRGRSVRRPSISIPQPTFTHRGHEQEPNSATSSSSPEALAPEHQVYRRPTQRGR